MTGAKFIGGQAITSTAVNSHLVGCLNTLNAEGQRFSSYSLHERHVPILTAFCIALR